MTRNTLRRSWVIYETGAADALNIERIPDRVAGIAHHEIAMIPGEQRFAHDLFDRQSVEDLVVKVLRKSRGLEAQHEQAYRKALRDSEELNRLIELASERWVFIAGNLLESEYSTRYPRSMSVEGKEYGPLDVSRFVTRQVTTLLLESGFSVASCANIESVGLEVMNAAHTWMEGRKVNRIDNYRIGELYSIDRAVRGEVASQQREYFEKTIAQFRASYLKLNEWLLILGGNTGTWEEFEAAKNLEGLRVTAIPALGGVAKRLWTERQSLNLGTRLVFPIEDLEEWNQVACERVVKALIGESG